jgi:arabinofuranosyltransferase
MKPNKSTSNPDERRARLRWVHVLLLAGIVCAVYFIALRAKPLWEARWVQDDAYVSFRYAKNLIHGDGLVYNVGERVEGYSNFLWTLLSAVPLAMGVEDPLHAMHILGLWLWACSYAFLIALGVRLFREGHWAAPLAAVPLAYHWSYNMWFVSGMETPLVSFLTIAAVCLFVEDPKRHRTTLFWASLAGVALTMARPDGIVIFGGIALAGLALYWRPLFRERDWRTYLWPPLLPVLLIWVPYNLWRVLYFGDFFPNTYYAKVGYLSYYARGWGYLRTYLGVYPFAAFGPLALAGAILARPGAARRYLWTVVLATACAFFYVVRLGGDFMEWRFVTPVTGVLYPAIVIGAGVCAEQVWSFVAAWLVRRSLRPPMQLAASSSWSRTAGLAATLCAAVTLARATDAATPVAKDRIVPGQENIALLSRYCDPRTFDWESVGRTYRQVLPPDIRIATTSAGIIPFLSEHHTLDLNGMTDPEIARRPVDENNRGRMGHEKWVSDFDQIRARGVDVFLYWAQPKPVALSLITPPNEGFEMVSMRLPDGRYTEFAILNHDRIDMAALRQDPRLVFYGSVPLADRQQLYAVKEKFKGYKTVDSVDLEEKDSHAQHDLEELYPPPVEEGHNWHDKLLLYRAPLTDILVHDNGFIPYGLRWKVRNVSARQNLVMVVRSDLIGGAIFDVKVNGKVLPGKLQIPGAGEAWDEISFVIPARFVVDGTNELAITRAEESKAASELYYLWFLQRPAGPIGEITERAEGDSTGARSDLLALRKQLVGLTLVDEVDIEEADSQAAHELKPLGPPGQPPRHDWHVKTLRYRPPLDDVTLTDNGVIPYGLEWQVDNVSAGRDLIMVVRFDRSGGGIYEVEVNGRKVPGELAFAGGPEAWEETAFTVPGDYVVDGANQFRMVRSERSKRSSELYYMWFLQGGSRVAPKKAG